MFLRNKESLDRAHKALEFSADYDKMSGQWKGLRVMELMQGNLEDSSKMGGEYVRTVLDSQIPPQESQRRDRDRPDPKAAAWARWRNACRSDRRAHIRIS